MVTNLMDGVRYRKVAQIPGCDTWTGGSVLHLHRVTQKTMLVEDVELDFFVRSEPAVPMGHQMAIPGDGWA